MKRLSRSLLASAFGCAGLIAAGTGGPAQAQPAQPVEYVALGDSFAAAPLVPRTDPGNLACLRSLSDYPHIAARALGARLTDVSCSGARVTDFSGRQFGFVPPQYKALSARTDIVSLTIGGNDTDLVTRAISCVNLLPEPLGTSCADRLTAGGRDRIAEDIDRWAPSLGTALDEIHRRAPHAKVFVVGYGTYIQQDGCFPRQPIRARDANYVQGAVNKLGDALRTQSAAHDATFVDTVPLSAGHDSCAPAGTRFIEGLVPTSSALPLHPNAAGSATFGAALAESVRTAG
ncbi:SGNH/GDSL hydrolase family protein [Streptomyces sp. H39-S7]|uniref:SGNH/GDSL hydrolase family protein n=1 Tax=Streptomyces sp. H39-S7 TaxID=3004357 RepID=UPI0022AF4409|nr:SGNH/GDSL hydrolase family protein [Streptomyces sp. H39-S7]MCZ4125028.1 SGNH/GDSL hydrolase family protein [Streptomyces sp. H39-S7]